MCRVRLDAPRVALPFGVARRLLVRPDAPYKDSPEGEGFIPIARTRNVPASLEPRKVIWREP